MSDPRGRQVQTRGHSLKPVPAHTPVLLAPPPQAVEPYSPDLLKEPVESAPVVGQAEVAVMAAQNTGVR